ncbi:GNAT family N-acetyltransferase [Acidobacteriota bacterium]
MQIVEVNRFEELRERSNEWQRLLESSPVNSVFLTQEWFEAWWGAFGADSFLSVFLGLDDKGSLLGVAPFLLRGDTMAFLACESVTDYCDFICKGENWSEFIRVLFHFIRTNYPKVKQIVLENIKESSPTLSIVSGLMEEGALTCRIDQVEVAPVLEIPLSYSDYQATLDRKNRHELRRKNRRAESIPELRLEVLQNRDEVAAFIPRFIQLHRESDEDKKTFWNRPGTRTFFLDMMERLAHRGWVKVFNLTSRGSLVASLLTMNYGDELSLYNITFKRDYAPYSPGYYLFNASIKDAISQRQKYVDFLRGDEKYKYSFGAKDCKIFHLAFDIGVTS